MPIPVPGRVAEALRQSTVRVLTGRGAMRGNGSGAVTAPEEVITNAHVLSAGGAIEVETWEGKTLRARVKRVHGRHDLALLEVPGLRAAAPLTLGDSRLLRPGTPVVAVGNPLGFVGAISTGVVHSVDPRRETWICSDLQLAPGNSGGPLANFIGQVVGLNTMIARGGLAFSIASRLMQKFLASGGERQSLGVTVRPVQLSSRARGLLILELSVPGGAHSASLLQGDVLLRAGGRVLDEPEALLDAIEEASNGLLPIEFLRGRQDQTRQVTARLAAPAARHAA